MNNENVISKLLIVLIVCMLGLTFVYTFINKDRIFKTVDVPNPNAVSNGNATQTGQTNSDNQPTMPKDDLDDMGDAGENASENPGLKTITTYAEFARLIARPDTNTFLVLGRKGCYYCEQYAPILTEVADIYKLEIQYVDMAALTTTDYNAVLNSGLTIPAKCSKTGEDVDLSKGFGTPLTLFVRNNETFDCIRGYKDRARLISSLKSIGYIK